MKKKLSNLVVVGLKPDADDFWREIIADIKNAGFVKLATNTVHLTKDMLYSLYKKHVDSEWFSTLIQSMHGKTMKLVIFEFKDGDAIREFQKLKGHKDPFKAQHGTLRKHYGTNTLMNAIDSSTASKETLEKIRFFFPEFEVEE